MHIVEVRTLQIQNCAHSWRYIQAFDYKLSHNLRRFHLLHSGYSCTVRHCIHFRGRRSSHFSDLGMTMSSVWLSSASAALDSNHCLLDGCEGWISVASFVFGKVDRHSKTAETCK
eukprot:m.405984 g.405984  ORF g.405984 m.405984 type:complete len:115 (+) comp21212_c1_seq7:1868-2212(+)